MLGEVRRRSRTFAGRAGHALILGLRDIMDDPTSLAEEWRRKRVIPALKRFYDQIWVYGLPQVYDPIEAYGFRPTSRPRRSSRGISRARTNPEVAPCPPTCRPSSSRARSSW